MSHRIPSQAKKRKILYNEVLDMARLAASHLAVVDLVTLWGSTPNPWTTLTSAPHAAVPATMRSLGYDITEVFGSLQSFVHTKKNVVAIQRHPLWNDQHPEWWQAVQDAESRYPHAVIKSMNPFRLLRRPADYV
jgi:DEAD/DEAH box helicase domain-containing protein